MSTTFHFVGFLLVSSHQVCFIESEYNPRSNEPHRWVLPADDPCKCTSIRLGGMMSHAASRYRQVKLNYLDKIILSDDPQEIRAFFNCPGKNLIYLSGLS